MLKRDMVKLVGGLLAVLTVLSGCGGTAIQQSAPAATVPTTTTPAAVQPATPTPAPPAPAGDLLAEGQDIFMKRAGGVGCQACHGVEAKGNTSVGAPDIRGRHESDVRRALDNVAMMQIIKLTDDEITAVLAYLQYLNK